MTPVDELKNASMAKKGNERNGFNREAGNVFLWLLLRSGFKKVAA
jgi:hypothetical protein